MRLEPRNEDNLVNKVWVSDSVSGRMVVVSE